MNNKVMKYATIALLVVDVAVAVFFGITLISAFTKFTVIPSAFQKVFYTAVVINAVYITFLIARLIIDKIIKNKAR